MEKDIRLLRKNVNVKQTIVHILKVVPVSTIKICFVDRKKGCYWHQ